MVFIEEKNYKNESLNNNLFKYLSPTLYEKVVTDVMVSPKRSNTDSYSTYSYDGLMVPRVTNVLKETINKDYLLYWAAKIGTKGLYAERKKATSIGTAVHSLIEYYLEHGHDNTNFDTSSLYFSDVRCVESAYANFKLWHDNVNRIGYTFQAIATELKVTCPFYGGTIDCIAKINGAVYIIDWKTSKKISPEYYIQAAAYMWLVNNGYCSEVRHVDGIGIVRLDKEKTCIEDSFLTYNNPFHINYIDGYIKTFEALLYAYYNLQYIDTFKHQYSLENIMEEIDI